MSDNNGTNKPKKMTKADRLTKLRMLLESYKKTEHEPEVTEIAKYLKCTRQTLYSDKDYSSILEEFEVGKRFKKNTIAPQEYLLERISSLEENLITKDNKIKKLQKKIADLEAINKGVEEDLAKEKKRLLRVQIYYLHLIETYNGMAKLPISIEPNDLQNLDVDPLDVSLSNDKNIANQSPKVLPINKH